MASLSIELLARPVRVLIRTRPAQLEKVHTSIEQADTELIKRFWVQQSNSADTTELCHLITRISDWKTSERVDIIFDYGVPTNERHPRVVAFDVKVSDSILASQLSHPLIQPKVNETVDRWGKDNLKYGLSFPSRSDVRRKRRALAHPQYKSEIHV